MFVFNGIYQCVVALLSCLIV